MTKDEQRDQMRTFGHHKVDTVKRTARVINGKLIEGGVVENSKYNPNYKGCTCVRITDGFGIDINADILKGKYGSTRSNLDITLRGNPDIDPVISTLKAITKILESPEVYV